MSNNNNKPAKRRGRKKRTIWISLPISSYVNLKVETDETLEEIRKRLENSNYPFNEYTDEVTDSEFLWENAVAREGLVIVSDSDKDITFEITPP